MRPAGEMELELRYDADAPALMPRFAERFVMLGRDAATDIFLKRAHEERAAWWRTRLHRVLRCFMSDFDANGLLDMYPLFIASTERCLAIRESHVCWMSEPAQAMSRKRCCRWRKTSSRPNCRAAWQRDSGALG